MHLVHFNRETYENLESATGQPNGLAVIAVLFSVIKLLLNFIFHNYMNACANKVGFIVVDFRR